MKSKRKTLAKKLITAALSILIITLAGITTAKPIYAINGFSYTYNSTSVTVIRDSTDTIVLTSTGLTCSNIEAKKMNAVSDGDQAGGGDEYAMYRTLVAGLNAWDDAYCSCVPFTNWRSLGFQVNGVPVGRITKGGLDYFCLDPTLHLSAYNCTGNWGSPVDGTYRFSSSQLNDIAKVIVAYERSDKSDDMYAQAQCMIWDITDGGYAGVINTSGIQSIMNSLDNTNYKIHKINMTGEPNGLLGTSFVMTDTKNEFGTSKFSVGTTSSGITVVKDGNTTVNTITQPYPITKTVNIKGSDTERYTEGDASIEMFPSLIRNAQSFAYFGRYANSVRVNEYPDTSYSVSMPTGMISFQKKDSNGNNVTSSYCADSGLCAASDANPVNNTFRLLIDNESQYWGTNADTLTEVVVAGKTYHIFQLENGTQTFTTNASGQINISNVLVGDYYLQEISVDTKAFMLNEELVKVTVNKNVTTNTSINNENLGIYDFQKKDSFDNNVYTNYCADTHLCIVETADATNNHFRVLIDDQSAYFNGFNDTAEEVTVEGKTYHVFRSNSGDTDFKTDSNGKMKIYLPKGHYYLQETSVDENVFIVNEELVELDITPANTTSGSMKNINLFGDFELQKYDEFNNAGLSNTYNEDASGNVFKLKYIDTLGRDVFSNKSFNLPDGTIAVNSQGYLEVDGQASFSTNSDGYFWICEDFNATRNLCVPFGNWQLEEVAVQNEFTLNDKQGENPMDVVIDVGQKTHTDYTNDYREIGIKLYKQDKADEVRVKGASYDLWDVDEYNVGISGKGNGNLYNGEPGSIFTSINKGDTKNFYDIFVSKQDGKFPDYNYIYNLETNGEDDKVADDKYIVISDNSETITGVSSGLTTVEVSKQLLDLYGTVQDRYYYIGDHSFDPYENLNLYLDEAQTIAVNIRDKSYKIEKVDTSETEVVDSAKTKTTYEVYQLHEQALRDTGLNILLPEPGEGGVIDPSGEVTITYNVDTYTTEHANICSIVGSELELLLEKHTESQESKTTIPTLNDMWDVEGKYLITYTIVDEARHKWTFTRYVTYEDDHLQVCEYNAVIGEYVWGDTKEICKDLDNDHPVVKLAPEEYDYDSRTVTYDPIILVHLVQGENEATPVGSFNIWCIDKTSKPEFARAGIDEVEHPIYLGEYTTDDNGEISINGLMHSRTYMICESGLPEGYTYDETENVCFIVEGNYAQGKEVKVNTKNNEITQVLIFTTAGYADGSKTYEFDGDSHTIVDSVLMLGLDMNTNYKLVGKLMSKADGQVVAEQEVEFTSLNNLKKYSLDMQFEVTPKKNIDQDYVVFEYLYKVGSDELVAEHTDINDQDQTVSVTRRNVEIATTAAIEGEKEKTYDFSETTVTDTVHYTNTFVGKESIMKASLIDKETGEVVAEGKKEFTPDALDGDIDVEIKFLQEENKDKTYVVFEELYLKFLGEDEAVAEHKDINDTNQCVDILEREMNMSTIASAHEFHISKDNTVVELKDKVEYENLVAGKDYMVKGYLIEKATNKEVVVNGKRIEGSIIFHADSEYGSIDVPFKFNAAIDKNNWLNDGDYVIYEEMYLVELSEEVNEAGETIQKVDSEKLILEHKQFDNTDQTFKFLDDYRYYRFRKIESETDFKPVNTSIDPEQ